LHYLGFTLHDGKQYVSGCAANRGTITAKQASKQSKEFVHQFRQRVSSMKRLKKDSPISNITAAGAVIKGK